MAATSQRNDFRSPARNDFGKPGRMRPTPVRDDFVITETGTVNKANFKSLPYGTPHPVFNGGNGARLALLVKETITNGDNNDQTWTRVYATDRLNQQLWSFSLAWALNGDAHAVVTRTKLVLRDDYIVVNGNGVATVNKTDNFTPDPAYPGALLVQESAAPAEEPYDSLWVRVTQVFETLPGPILVGEERTKIGRTVTLIPPEFLGAEDITITTQVVRPGTPADTLSATVLSSVVTAIDATHSQKVNITRAANPYPTLVNLDLDQSHGGATTATTRQIIAPGTPLPTGFLVVDASQKALSADNTLQEVTSAAGFPTLGGAGFDSNLPAEYLQGFDLLTMEDWIDTTTLPAAQQLVTGPLVISCKTTPESATRSKRVTVSLPPGSVLPTLKGDQAGRPIEQFPGIFGNGDGGAEQWEEAVVPTGGTFISSIAGAVELSREPINAGQQRLRLGVRYPATGVSAYAGSRILPDGSLATVTYVRNGTGPAPGYGTVGGEVRPIGAGQTMAEIVTQGAPPTRYASEGGRVPVPEALLAGQLLTTTDQPVAAGTAATVTPSMLSSVVRPDGENAYRSRSVLTALASGDLTSLPSVASHDRIARDGDGAAMVETLSVVSATAGAPTLDFLTTSVEDRGIGNNLLLRTARRLDGTEFPKLTRYSLFDKEMGVYLKEVRQIVDATLVTKPDPPTGGIGTEFEPLDRLRSIQIVRALIIPSTIPDEYGRAGANRPMIIHSITSYNSNGHLKVLIQADNARAYIAQTRTRRRIGVGLSRETVTPAIVGANLNYQGYYVREQLNNYLFDGNIEIEDDGTTLTFAATSPTASGYQSLIGTEHCTAATVRDYGLGLQLYEDTYETYQ